MVMQPLLQPEVATSRAEVAAPLRSIEVVSLHLKLGSRGRGVTLLHSYLLLLYHGQESATSEAKSASETVPLSELATATFGSGTRLAVLNFQRQNRVLLATSPSGIADQETIAVLKAKIHDAGVDWDHPETSFVVGAVYYSDGSPGTQLEVCISDRDVGAPDKKLADLQTDSCGYFATQYTANMFYHSGTGRRPTLVTKIVRDQKVLFSSSLDQAIFCAPALAVIQTSLSEASPAAPASNEFTQVFTALKAALLAASKQPKEHRWTSHDKQGKGFDDETRNRIADLREDDERHDIEYLARLKPFQLSMPTVTTAILASRLSKEAAENRGVIVSPEVFYALLATETQQKFLSRDSPKAGLSNVTLKSPPALLLHQFGQLDLSVIKSALEEAIKSNAVPPIHWDSKLAKAWEKIRHDSNKWMDTQPTVEDVIWTGIDNFLSSGQEDAVRKVLYGESYEGDVQGLLKDLIAAFQMASSSGDHRAEFLNHDRITSGTNKSGQKLAASLRAKHGAQNLANMSHESLRHLVASAPTEHYAAGYTERGIDAVDAATMTLRHELEQELPTTVFTSKLGDHIEHASQAKKKHAHDTDDTIQASISLGHPSLKIDSHTVHHFLRNNPDLDLRSGRLKKKQSNSRDEDSKMGQIAKVQRVFKLAPTFEKASALLDHGLHSASQVAAFKKSDFVKKLSASPAFTSSEAKKVHDRASNIHLGTNLLATDIRSTANALLPAGLSSPLPPTKLQALNAEFPDIASLFSYGDICACADCMTVYSPSAYLVDVLEFLRYRGVLDSAGGPNNGKTARDVLLERRPDLANLDLSCDNTNVTLPLIDLVCELLEGYVAPDGLSPGTFNGNVDKGKISADLLGFLRDDMKLPFSGNAVISDTYNGGWRTVRDSTAVVSLSPASPYAVRVLRQTYGHSTTLAASPAYVNYAAYNLLAESVFLPSLPFDLNLEECRGYLLQLGTSREQLIKDLAGSNHTYNAALEMLSLTTVAGMLITRSDPSDQDLYWNTGDPAGPVNSLQNVKMFLDATQMEYTDLQMMMNATEWFNPPENPSTARWPPRVGFMYVKHLDSSCTLAKKSIIGLDSPALDRLHRFIRLWKSLKSSSGTWNILNLDRAIGAPRLGASDLDPRFISTILTITDMTSMLSSAIPTSVNDVIDLFSVLRPSVDVGTASTSDVTYTSLFLNTTAHGPIDPLFKLDAIALNDAVPPPTIIPQIDDTLPYLSTCLGVPVSDLVAVLPFVTASAGNRNLTIGNLSLIYAVVSLCNRLAMSIPQFFLFRQMSGLEPLNTIDQLKVFVKTVTEMRSLSLQANDVQLLTQPASNPRAPNDITDATIIAILTNLQKQYVLIQSANKSPFDAQLGPDDNEGPALALIAQIPQPASDEVTSPSTISQIDLSQFRSMLGGSLATSVAASLIHDKLQPTIGQNAANAIVQAQSDLASSGPNQQISARNDLAKVMADTLSSYFATSQRRKALLDTIVTQFGIPVDSARELLDGVASLQPLVDESLASGQLSEGDQPSAFLAIRLLFRLALLLSKSNVTAIKLSWLIGSSPQLGWADLTALPTTTASTPILWSSWIATVAYLTAIKSADFPDVTNPAEKTTPFTLEGLLTLASLPAADIVAITAYFCGLTSHNATDITDLIVSFGFTPVDFESVATLRTLDVAANSVRKCNMTAVSVISLATGPTVSRDDTSNAREGLKLRYPNDKDWLNALKVVQDRLRVMKRDALVSYLLAINKSGISSPQDISELILIDVEMGTETLTSRIIQGHASVQQFVQRLLMGLEPTPLVPGDPAWAHWTEMSQYRVWEANRKVFLYPENWIEPELRTDKSEIYVKAEDTLQKQPLTTTNIEMVFSEHLRDLDDIAYLEVFTCFYDVPSTTLHVFARSKGGNPRLLYHRSQFMESVWSPWERMDGVKLPGDHAAGFLRNNRLTLVWPVFDWETDPVQGANPPEYADPKNLQNPDGSMKTPPPVKKRLVVQLGISERNPDTGKWSAPLTAEGAVYLPPNGIYLDAATFNNFSESMISLQYWELGNNLGEVIVACLNYKGRGRNVRGDVRSLRTPEMVSIGITANTAIFGVFNITGCKGYPLPFDPQAIILFSSYPQFESTEMTSGRFAKSSSLATNSPASLTIETFPDFGNSGTMLEQEKGRFYVTYPCQPSIIDRFIVALQLHSRSSEKEGFADLRIPLGSFLPYFVTDSSTRSYQITPGYKSGNLEDDNFRSASAVFDFFDKAKNLALKYIAVYFGSANKDINEVRKLIEADDAYKVLKAEWLNVYVDATGNRGVRFRESVAETTNFYHPLVCYLLSKLYSGGIDAVLARTTQIYQTKFDFKSTYNPTDRILQPFPREDLDFSLNGPFTSYNYDLVMFLPLYISNLLTADGQYEQAQRWLNYMFNPVGADLEDPDTGPDRATAPQKRYWQTKPFYRMQIADYAEQRIDSILAAVANDPDGLSLSKSIQTQISLWRSRPFAPDAIAKARPVAYQVCIVMRYIQNLVDWGDSLFRQLTRETVNQASVLYMVADKLLGSKPKVVQPAVPVPPRTYNELNNVNQDIGGSIDKLGNAMLSLENLLPDLSTLPHGGQELPDAIPPSPLPAFSLLYFGIPPNDTMLRLWDLVADRLNKIRHSQDIDGNFVQLALTSPPIDPGALIKALASGASLSDILSGLNAPLPNYRFQYVFDQAIAMVQDVVELGQELLSVLEKRDTEGLARLRANSETNVLTAVGQVKQDAIDQNTLATAALTASKVMATTRHTYYDNLIKAPPNYNEAQSLAKNDDATQKDSAMANGHKAAAILNLVPSFSVGIAGCGGSPKVSVSYGGSNIAASITSFMAETAAHRNTDATDAQTFLTSASFDRRSAEWAFQRDLAQNESDYIDAQLKTAAATATMLTDDLTAHNTSEKEAKNAQHYLESKYTNTELYQWAIGRVSGTYSLAYQLALSMAKKAERCMAFELGDFSDGGTLIGPGSWDNLRNGLLAGNDLRLGLRRLQSAYMDRSKRELELTKAVSLAQVAPEALLDLRTTGSCMFSIPESLLDMDYPGHYFRRTKSISLYIPCLVGPWTSISATLRLLSSRYRSEATGTTAATYAESPAGGDTRFTYNVVPPPAITASASASNDAGVFELSLKGDDPRYLPFEYAGVLGTYQLSLPPVEQFSYLQIADAILNISYTARDGGSTLREAAMVVPTTASTAISLRNTFQADWNAFKAGRIAQPVLVTRAQVPFWTTSQGRGVKANETMWCVTTNEGSSLNNEVLIVAATELPLQKDSSGNFWKATLPSGKATFGKPVTVAWKNAGTLKSVTDIICVVSLAVNSP